MKLTKTEYGALARHVRGGADVGVDLKLAIAALDPTRGHADMRGMGRARLETLLAALPHGTGTSLTHPVLTRVKDHVRTTIAGLRTPHLDPDSWPQAWRMQSGLNTKRAGIRDAKVGQMMILHSKARSLSMPLRGVFQWTRGDSGDVHLMGAWSDLAAMLGGGQRFEVAMGDILAGDVNVEWERMYGDATDRAEHDRVGTLPLTVSFARGALFAKTDDEGEVVLNAPRQIVETVASKATGIHGTIATATPVTVAGDVFSTAVSNLADHVVPGLRERSADRKLNEEQRLDKTRCTITVGIGPFGDRSVVGRPRLTGAEVLTLARQLHY